MLLLKEGDAAMKSAFADFTRQNVAQMGSKLANDQTLAAKLRSRLATKLKAAEQELSSLEADVPEATPGDYSLPKTTQLATIRALKEIIALRHAKQRKAMRHPGSGPGK